ncbi:hypothetical protein DENSPDRAFT_670880 [Dentipellis sp. KUC8613]|nr:hypothetical protein DENSPDRAFT_670880 [Dentipellis sp. KUC8613]
MSRSALRTAARYCSQSAFQPRLSMLFGSPVPELFALSLVSRSVHSWRAVYLSPRAPQLRFLEILLKLVSMLGATAQEEPGIVGSEDPRPHAPCYSVEASLDVLVSLAEMNCGIRSFVASVVRNSARF